MAGTVLQAFIFRDGEFLGTEMLTGDRIEIGRESTCGLVLDDDMISRRHAAITVVAGQLYVEDLQSVNGTTVNGEEVEAPLPLTGRDDVCLGRHVVKFKLLSTSRGRKGGAKPSAAPAPARQGGSSALSARPDSTLPDIPQVPGGGGVRDLDHTPNVPPQPEVRAREVSAPPPPDVTPPLRPAPPAERSSPPLIDAAPGPAASEGEEQPWDDLTQQSAPPPPSAPAVAARHSAPPPMAHREAPGVEPMAELEADFVAGARLGDDLFGDLLGIQGHPPALTMPARSAPPPPKVAFDATVEPPAPPASVPPADAVATGVSKLFDDGPGNGAGAAQRDPTPASQTSLPAEPVDDRAIVAAEPAPPARVADADPTAQTSHLTAAVPPSKPAAKKEAKGFFKRLKKDRAEKAAAPAKSGKRKEKKRPEPKHAARQEQRVDAGRTRPPVEAPSSAPGPMAAPARAASRPAKAAPAAPPRIEPIEPEPPLPDLAAPAWADEDYDPHDEPAPYSLLDNLLAETFSDATVKQTKRPLLEVIHFRPDEVVNDLIPVLPGQAMLIGQGLKRKEAERVGVPANHRLVRVRRDGSAELIVLESFQGQITSGGRSQTLSERAEWHGPKGLVKLAAGDAAHLAVGPHRYAVRFAYPPALLQAVTRRGKPTAEQRREMKWTLSSFGASLGGHLSVLLVLFISSLLSPRQLVTQLEEDRFVQMNVEELELEKPPEEEEPEAAPEEEAPPETKKPQQRLSNKTAKTKKPGIMAALGKIPLRAGPAGSQTLTAAVSNLDAVKVPGGGASYKVTGLIGKGPTNRVRIGGSGGGISTKGLASILREGGGGPGVLSKMSKGAVRGRLVKASRGSKMKGQGYLDRAEIQKVVNKGLGQIQFCYEKELLKNQSLSGKVVFEWTISRSGAVSIVKTNNATLQSPTALQCMIGSIKRWVFPAPRGGEVIVTYPFIFNAMGF